MSLSVRTRFEVLKRDRFTCSYCGRTPPEALLEVDHIIPVAAGGSDDIDNLTTACWDCNRGKSDRLLVEGTAPLVSQRAVEEAQLRAEQARAYAEAVQARRDLESRFFQMVTEEWAIGFGATLIEETDGSYWRLREYERFPNQSSVKRILTKLPVDQVIEAAQITSSKFSYANAQAERYFFGVCWKKITEHEAER